MKIAIIYSSKYGTVEKVAHAIQNELNEHEVFLYNLKDCTPPLAEKFDTIILGTSIYAGKIRPEMERFCADHESEITASAELHLFVCGMDLEKAEIQKNAFGQTLTQRAKSVRFIPGEFHLEKMNFFERTLLRIFFKVKENLERDYSDLVKDFLAEETK